MKTTIISAFMGACTLMGCAEVDVADELSKTASFLLLASERGATIGDGIYPEERAAYVSAAAATWGPDLPDEWAPVIHKACDLSVVVSTPYDAEAEDLCNAIKEGTS